MSPTSPSASKATPQHSSFPPHPSLQTILVGPWYWTPPPPGANSSTFRCSQVPFDSSDWQGGEAGASPHPNPHSPGQYTFVREALFGSLPPHHLLASHSSILLTAAQSFYTASLLLLPKTSARLSQSVSCPIVFAQLVETPLLNPAGVSLPFLCFLVVYQKSMTGPQSPLFSVKVWVLLFSWDRICDLATFISNVIQRRESNSEGCKKSGTRPFCFITLLSNLFLLKVPHPQHDSLGRYHLNVLVYFL